MQKILNGKDKEWRGNKRLHDAYRAAFEGEY